MFWSVRLSQGRHNQLGQSMGGGAGIEQISAIAAAALATSPSSPVSLRTNDFVINNTNIDSDADLNDDNSEPIDTISQRFLAPQTQPPRKRSLVQALLNSANLTPSNKDNSAAAIKMFMDSGSSTMLPPASGIHNFGMQNNSITKSIALLILSLFLLISCVHLGCRAVTNTFSFLI